MKTMQHSSETCYTENGSSISIVTTQETTPCILKLSPKQLPEWSILSNFNQIKVNDIVVYDNDLAHVTFIDQHYIVITPQEMQYGICVFPEGKERVKYLSTGTGQLSTNIPVR